MQYLFANEITRDGVLKTDPFPVPDQRSEREIGKWLERPMGIFCACCLTDRINGTYRWYVVLGPYDVVRFISCLLVNFIDLFSGSCG